MKENSQIIENIDEAFAPEQQKIKLNRPQLMFFTLLWANKLKSATTIASRGSGKSFLIAILIDYINRNMPRSNWAIQGESYQQILTRTLPATCEGLDLLGYKRDVNYWIGRRPPIGPDMPFNVPIKFDYYLTLLSPDRKYYTGFNLLSQEASSRGPSVDGIISDESLLLDVDKYVKETSKTNRGHQELKAFRDLSCHHGEFHFTSMPYNDQGEWLTNHASYYKEYNYNFELLKDELIDLQIEFLDLKSTKERLQLWTEIERRMQELKFFICALKNPDGSNHKNNGLYYNEFSVFDNLENVGIQYLLKERELAEANPTVFLVEMMNKRVRKIEQCFYVNLDRKIHGYKGHWNYEYLNNLGFDFGKLKSPDSRQDADCNPDLPLEIGFDFGNINWLIVAQEVKKANRINYLKEFWAKGILDIVVQNFCDYYQHHTNRNINIWPDAQGNNNVPNANVTFVQQAVSIFKKNKWNPTVKNHHKKNTAHNDKYLIWALSCQRKDSVYPQVGINIVNCPNLIVSMENAPARDEGGQAGIQKDKSSERRLKNSPMRIQATDASDAADQIMYGKYKHLLPSNRGASSFYHSNLGN